MDFLSFLWRKLRSIAPVASCEQALRRAKLQVLHVVAQTYMHRLFGYGDSGYGDPAMVMFEF